MEEEEVEGEIAFADLDAEFAGDVAEVAAEFDEEGFEFLEEAAVEVGLGVVVGEVEEVGVFEDGCGGGV